MVCSVLAWVDGTDGEMPHCLALLLDGSLSALGLRNADGLRIHVDGNASLGVTGSPSFGLAW